MKTNETVARLDREAARLGLDLVRRGRNCREFGLPGGRTIRYLSRGKGTLRVCAYVDGELDAETVCAPERIERLFIRATVEK